MIVGVLLRHYKIYEGINFIPICDRYNWKYSILIGNNGVGKSSILEALATFFNDAYWNRNKRGKKDEAFIAPIFLVKKDEYSKRCVGRQDEATFLEFISNYFWNVTDSVNANLRSDEYKIFFEFRERMKNEYSSTEYYFFLLGIEYESKSKVHFATFNDDLRKKIPPDLGSYDINRLLEFVKEYYSFVYLPIETATSDILKLENREMQELMNTDILQQIDAILTTKDFSESKRKFSILDSINSSLNTYMDSINSVIQGIDDEYAFKVENGYKRNLTSSDVRDKILEAYFSIRTLKKDSKEIYELSSGEQRIALIDVATAFLLESSRTSKCVVLAIDEPETSLHISRSFNQFQRLQSLAENNQVILTTHWYGSLPITEQGTLQHFEKQKKISIKSFNFPSFYEQRRQFPEDVLLKSYFELTSSILSSIRAKKTNWIICEGSDDKQYLECYLDNIPNLKVLAVGGCGNVKKLYQYLFAPFTEKSEIKAIDGRILCLTDTDYQLQTLDIKSSTKDNKLRIGRIQIEPPDKIEIKDLDGKGNHFPTEIEDCLTPRILFDALKLAICELGTSEQKEAIAEFDLNDLGEISPIKGEKSILKPRSLEAMEKKEEIYKIIDNYRFKYVLAEKYSRILQDQPTVIKPKLFEKIEEFFKP